VQGAAGTAIVTRNVELGVDPFQNYFLIFHEGRTYRGTTAAMIDLSANTVTGALQGTDPAGIQPFTAVAGGGVWIPNALPIVNRGLNGGFLANITQKNAVLAFSGTGQLSSAANPQTVSITALPIITPGIVPPIDPGTVTNLVTAGQVVTTSTPFNIRGLRTSYFASNAVSSATLIGQ
jgi:hypothetical protein